MRRRSLLAAVGVGTVGTAGLISVHDPTTLRAVVVGNQTDQLQTVDIRIGSNGDIVLERTLELDPHENHQLSCEWPNPARTYSYGGKFTGESEWTQGTIDVGGDQCRLIEITDDELHTDSEDEYAILLQSLHTCPEAVSNMYGEPACENPDWVRLFRT